MGRVYPVADIGKNLQYEACLANARVPLDQCDFSERNHRLPEILENLRCNIAELCRPDCHKYPP